MKTKLLIAAATSGTAVAIWVAASSGSAPAAAPAPSYGSAPSPSSSAIDLGNGDTFAPADSTKAALSASDAVTKFDAKSGMKVPSDLPATYGLLTTGPKDGSYGVYQQPAYMLLVGNCIAGSALSGQQPSPPADNCRFALFLDANTGDQIVARNYTPAS